MSDTPEQPQSEPAAGEQPQRPPLPAQSAADAAQAAGAAAPAEPEQTASAPQAAPTAPPVPPTPPVHTDAFATMPTQPYPDVVVPPVAEASPAPRADASRGGSAGKIAAIIVAAALVGGVAGLGGAALWNANGSNASVTTSGEQTSITINDPDEVNQTTAIAAKALPSVVTISASSSSGGGTGSGVVLSEDGYVVTNTHVVTLDGATADPTLQVTTSDGAVYAAEIVGTDPIYDLAVIKLTDAEGLTPIEFADSSALNVGDQTVALGAPLGLANTVTTGIVSALNRSIQIASSAAPDTGETEEDGGSTDEGPFQFDFGQGQQQSGSTGTISIAVIQTDAAINPGNSGGALVDDQGRLIGVNVAIATASGSSSESAGSIGVGFSIPANVVERVSDEIIENGSATHGLLGAMVGDAAAQDGATTNGAYVDDVTPGGAAATAGLASGDVITSFNGVPIADATDLTAQVRALGAGTEAEVVYQRDGRTETVTVTLGELTT